MNDKIQLKRGTLANWLKADPVLMDGEMALVATDASKPTVYDSKKVGDGTHKFSELEMLGYDCLQELGDSLQFPMSQKAITDWINQGYQFRGIATPDTNPGTPDGPVFYIASEPGTYTNFNGIKIIDNEFAIIKQKNSVWNKEYITVVSKSDFVALKKIIGADTLTSLLKNGGAGNSSNDYKVRTCGIDIRGISKFVLKTTRPNTDDAYYRYEVAFSNSISSIGQFYATNEPGTYSPYGMLSAQKPDSIIQVPANAVSAVVAIYEIPNNGEEGDITLRTDSFNGYRLGLSSNIAEILSSNNETKIIDHEARISVLEGSDAYERNKHKIIALGAACRQRKTSQNSKDYQFIEFTDAHGDIQAIKNAISMTNGFSTVDAVINCGDTVGDYLRPNDTIPEIMGEIIKCKKPWFNVIGNHEAGTYNTIGWVPSIQHMYDVFIKPMVDAKILKNNEYTAGTCHYYHDLTDYSIRLICVNEYDGDLALNTEYWEPVEYNESAEEFMWKHTYNIGDIIKMPNGYIDNCFRCVKSVTTGTNIYSLTGQEPRYKLRPGERMLSQKQAQWFLDTLANTPSNYSVIIAMHNPFSDMAVTVNDKKFNDSVVYGGAQNQMADDFFADAVNAFMEGTQYSCDIAFKQLADYRNTKTNSSGKKYAYSVSKDFSQKNTGVKFMCYLGGHVHKDCIWQHKTYKSQWQVTPVCAATSYHQSPTSDIRRSKNDGLAYDSITSISFNTERREISLVKIGVDITENMEYRDFEKIELK